eukprot:m.413567 g.413567  ORF g.413567 m.413567 type:complete len:246 (+) comp29120_c0_seq1:69-806(+)
MARLLLLVAGIAHALTAVSAQTAAFNFQVRCFDSAGAVFDCGSITFVQTVRENNAGAAFSFSDPGTDPNAGGVVLDPNNTVATNLNSTATTPQLNTSSNTINNCPIEQFCTCTGTQITNLVIGSQTANGVIGCTGFVESNTTAVQELQNATSAECAIEVVSTVNVTLANGTVEPQNITFCFSDPTLITDNEECNDNTAVIVIIIICVLMLLVVLVIGAYYLVHGNTLNERPVETSVVHNPKMSAL